MYNVTLRCIHATIVAVEKQEVLHFLSVCSLRYSECNVRVPYCNLWPVQLLYIFPHLINGIVFDK